ncbi:hypothetical protein [Salinibacterium sp. GXW1014]|uniref:hypothetical protein n=1 Tax=Salinibacterium sp. GXW1014 TaxID=3377838 RepID=UPI00383AADF3
MNVSRLLAATAAAALATSTLAGCAVIDMIFEDGPPKDPEERHFEVYADAPTTGQLAFAMPSFVPKDATDIDVRLMPSAEPGYLLRYTSSKGFKDARCEPIAEAPPAAIDSTWWPDEEFAEAWECNEKRMIRPVYVSAAGDTVYAWTSDLEAADMTPDATPEAESEPAPKTTDGTPGAE